MKTRIRIALVLMVIAVIFVGFTVARAALQTYNSSIQVQNLDPSTKATISLYFYDRQGNLATTKPITDTVNPNSSNTYFPLDTTGHLPGTVPPGFDGSAVIESNTKVASVTNIVGSDGSDPMAYGASYTGFSSGSPTAYLPLLMAGNYGFNTWISVQNVGGSVTNITATYSDGKTATVNSVQPGAAAKFDQSKEGHTGTHGWVGSGTITNSANQNLVATVLQVGPTTLFAYNSFTAGTTNPVMPLFSANNYGFNTGIQVLNTGNADSDITVSYTPAILNGQPAGTACTEVRTVPKNTSITFGLYVFTNFAESNPSGPKSTNCVKGQFFVGSARITANTNSVPVETVVNQLNQPQNKGDSYRGFDPATGTNTVVFPLLMDRNYGYWTGFSVINVGGSTVTASSIVCTVTGKGASGTVTKTFSPPNDLAPFGSWTQNNINTIDNLFVGSGTCVGPAGSQLVGVVNELKNTKNKNGLDVDTLLTYEGTNP
jgi:hypothetical protein